MNNWFVITDIELLDSPVMVVYPDRVEKNIVTLIGMVDDVARLRPHVKTHKNPEVTKRLLAAGITKFKCATIAEAEMLAQCGAPDILLAYQPAGPKITRLISLIRLYPRITFGCLTDHVTSATQINDVASRSGVVINVYVDLNVGMNRTGIAPGKEALSLYQLCARCTNLKVIGLHA